jgi:hypothetical protein
LVNVLFVTADGMFFFHSMVFINDVDWTHSLFKYYTPQQVGYISTLHAMGSVNTPLYADVSVNKYIVPGVGAEGMREIRAFR